MPSKGPTKNHGAGASASTLTSAPASGDKALMQDGNTTPRSLLTMDNLRSHTLDSLESLTGTTSRGSFADTKATAGNFFNVKQRLTPTQVSGSPSPNPNYIAGYDSDSSRGSSEDFTSQMKRRSRDTSSQQSDVVVDFVYDSDDSSSEDDSDCSSENDEVALGANARVGEALGASVSSPAASTLLYTLSVPRWEYLKPEEGQEPPGDVGYIIAIDSTQNASLSWTVVRTFSQFYEWRGDMTAHLKGKG